MIKLTVKHILKVHIKSPLQIKQNIAQFRLKRHRSADIIRSIYLDSLVKDTFVRPISAMQNNYISIS